MISYEYRQFLNDKILEYLPSTAVKIGNKINMRCPICGDSAKSYTKKRGWWYNDTASYYCFNCSTGLAGIKFLELLSGQDYLELKKEYIKLFIKSGNNTNLSATYSIPDKEPSIFDIKRMVKPEWKNPLTDKAKKYLADRLVINAPFYQNNLYSWTSESNKEFILIDWKLNGIDAYFQLNDFLKHGKLKYIFPKNTKKLIAGLDNIDVSWPYIIVFEGFYDSVFVKNGICVGTKAITDYQLNIIKERFPKHQIVISFDNDISGIESMKKLIKSNYNFKFFKWFNSNTKQKDINEYVLFKNDVNIFTDTTKLEKLFLDKLLMKMYLIKNHLWTTMKEKNNDTSTLGKERQILKRCYR